MHEMKRSVIFDEILQVLAPVLSMVALFLLVSGHNAPGGGFVAGLVAAGISGIFYVAQGPEGLERIGPRKPVKVMASGLAISAMSGIVPLLFGQPFLAQRTYQLSLPIFGVVKVSSSLIFDAGVMLVVVGSISQALIALAQGREKV